MRMSSYAVLCGLASVLMLSWSAGGAVARDHWDRYGYYSDELPPSAYYPPAPPVGAPRSRSYAPPVYGWSRSLPYAPSSCGVHHYWNGERCADARHEPPDLSRRW